MPELIRFASIAETDRRAKRRTGWGVAASVAWLLISAVFVWWKRDGLADLGLNDWADVFAGMTAPLAFLWLALGYFQQGDELRQNTEALLHQEAELQRQADATSRLVDEYSRQAEASAQLAKLTAEAQRRADEEKIRVAAPRFVGGPSTWGANVSVSIRNIGANAHDVTLTDAGGTGAGQNPRAILATGESIDIPTPRLSGGTAQLVFACKDVYGTPYLVTVILDGKRASFDITQRRA